MQFSTLIGSLTHNLVYFLTVGRGYNEYDSIWPSMSGQFIIVCTLSCLCALIHWSNYKLKKGKRKLKSHLTSWSTIYVTVEFIRKLLFFQVLECLKNKLFTKLQPGRHVSIFDIFTDAKKSTIARVNYILRETACAPP